jgi:hypothetical protein
MNGWPSKPLDKISVAGVRRRGWRRLSERQVQPELLDQLPPDTPAARRARHDLRRINALMGNASIIARELNARQPPGEPWQLVDLGGGDGHFAWRVIRRLAPRDGTLVVVDRQPAISPEMLARMAQLGWCVSVVQADALEWLRSAEAPPVWMANLFLHHLHEPQLRGLFAAARTRASLVVACDPQRSATALWMVRLLALVGCSGVTRHDAELSVRAGFQDRELVRCWGDDAGWKLDEGLAGWWSHRFVAARSPR